MNTKCCITGFLLLCALALSGQERISTDDYIETYAGIAVSEMQRTGIPASITLAQGILESGSGNSRLARKGNNHFGIKCHNDWTGQKIFADDDKRNECFRKYKDAAESFKDHSEFLTQRSRYAFLFDYDKDDYRLWAKGLRKAGYATNPQYATLLIDLIERHELYEYDDALGVVSADNPPRRRKKDVQPHFGDDFSIDPYHRKTYINNQRPYIIAREGDIVRSLAQELEMMPWQFYKYNDMARTDSIYPSQMVYIKPKRNKAAKGFDTHTVAAGETLWEISQFYAVKMKKLRKKNELAKDERVKAGDIIHLRKNKDGTCFLGIF